MSISNKMKNFMERASWIRKMFEEGARLKREKGEDNVFDFSLGNPNLAPPREFRNVLKKVVEETEGTPHGYMPNAGYEATREKIASFLSTEQNVEVSSGEVIMTCGAAGGINIALKAILNQGDEVIIPSPYFVEYNFYIDNHGGVPVIVDSGRDFLLNIDSIESAINEKTKAVLINSPNNPSGRIFPKDNISAMANILKEHSKRIGHPIYLISDEPYRRIVFDNNIVPSLFDVYPDTIIVYSHSKDLSIAGERIGYLAVNPNATDKQELIDAIILANRILGFVNAPALMQKVVADLQGITVDISLYQNKRDMLCEALENIGYEFLKPEGAFYLFPRALIEDDVAFVQEMFKENILVVPGTGFGGPGYFRIAFCVSDQTISRSFDAFKRVWDKFK